MSVLAHEQSAPHRHQGRQSRQVARVSRLSQPHPAPTEVIDRFGAAPGGVLDKQTRLARDTASTVGGALVITSQTSAAEACAGLDADDFTALELLIDLEQQPKEDLPYDDNLGIGRRQPNP
ncbi:hypothetical protein K7711_32465 [Nocardia sp. CA2R105]|uniref:hypothetical protein n=1 Tax=Nocardia coffeae TaxID=2873381 RepID=UPI001CA77EF7|nr:hypothetical protein [Nocardia coffeae]MBY8861229.1 hypothetical protein [Nocardia coffeae]